MLRNLRQGEEHSFEAGKKKKREGDDEKKKRDWEPPRPTGLLRLPAQSSKGAGCKSSIIIKSNPFLKKKAKASDSKKQNQGAALKFQTEASRYAMQT
jgi:hypothetical protein